MKHYFEVDEAGTGLTIEELIEGWHFCPDWDYMLVGPDMKMEWEACSCFRGEEK